MTWHEDPPATRPEGPELAVTAAPHPSPLRDGVNTQALWFGLFGGPLFWSLQELVNYTITAHFCFPQALPLPVPTFDGTWWVALVVEIAALIGALVAGAVSWHSWRLTKGEHRGGYGALLDAGEGRTRFMAYAGMLSSGLFALAIILSSFALFIVPACLYGA
ncbi:MAG: hypothetical protein ACREOJ_15295 [Gemmatimonadaceae bacterium]